MVEPSALISMIIVMSWLLWWLPIPAVWPTQWSDWALLPCTDLCSLLVCWHCAH